MKTNLIASLLVAGSLTVITGYAQTANRPTFEVASVKPYNDAGTGPRNAHFTWSPQGVDFGARTVAFLIGEAYGVPVGLIMPDQTKTPERTKTKDAVLGNLRQGYDIVARVDHPISKND